MNIEQSFGAITISGRRLISNRQDRGDGRLDFHYGYTD